MDRSKYVMFLSVMLLSACATGPIVSQIQDQGIDLDQKEETVTTVPLGEYCANNPCRRNHEVRFRTKEAEIDQVLELYWPVVQGDRLSLLPGDEVFIEAEIENGRLTGLKEVESIVDKSKTLSFDFQQMDDDVGMLLVVKNPFEKMVKMNLDMIDFEGNLHQTSSCPIMAGKSIYEMWPHPIPEIMVTNMRTKEDAATMVCEY